MDKVVDFLDIVKEGKVIMLLGHAWVRRQVRHCCFIIGPTGAGKTEIWRSLEMALIAVGEDRLCVCRNRLWVWVCPPSWARARTANGSR